MIKFEFRNMHLPNIDLFIANVTYIYTKLCYGVLIVYLTITMNITFLVSQIHRHFITEGVRTSYVGTKTLCKCIGTITAERHPY